MDLSKISHEKVRAAIQALQDGDKSFYTYFTEKPEMTDDGNPKDFHDFFEHALGTEKFLTLDSIENGGLELAGDFDAGKWGTFKVYFKFHENSEGKFNRLDIGQVSKLKN